MFSGEVDIFNSIESETALCFWAQTDVLGSPDHQIAFVSYSQCNTILAFLIIIKEKWRKKILKTVQSPIGHVLNCFEKEVVLFLVFKMPVCHLYFVRNQSLM